MIWIIVGIIIIVMIYVISLYNGLVVLRNKVKTNWAQIDVVLKRRADLIPNLVETVKGYATHEKETLNQVVEARNAYVHAASVQEQIDSSQELSQVLSRLLMLAEAYPDLKANTNFIQLQTDLTETEDKISFARQFYNDSVYAYQNKREVFPSSLIAQLFGFKEMPFYQVEEESKEVPHIKF